MIFSILNRYMLLMPLFLFFHACTTLGPDYREPEVQWLDEWQSDLYGQVGSPEQQAQVDLRFWWRLFDDPALNRLIELARMTNPSMRIAGLRILESRAALGIATGLRYPQVQQATGALAYVRNQQYGESATEKDQDLVSYQAGFDIGWELDFWGRFRRGIESADAAFFASIHNQQDLQVLLSAQIADLYYAYYTNLQRIAIARDNVAIQKRSYDITERRYKSGQESELDLQQAKTQYLATLSTIPALEIAVTQFRNALCALLARAPGDLPELGETARALPTVDPVVFQGIPAFLLKRRPDVRAAAWQVAAQSAQIGIAEAQLYPAVSLLGTIGWSGNTLGGIPDTGALVVGPSFTWNLFNYGRIKNNVRVQDARLQQTIESFQERVLRAAREIEDAAISMLKTHEQKAVLGESVQAAERSLKLANTLFREGYADFQRVLDAQRALAAQSEREIINQGDHISAVINFYKALGGGWLNPTIDTLVPESMLHTMETRSDWGDLLEAPLPDPSPSNAEVEKNE